MTDIYQEKAGKNSLFFTSGARHRTDIAGQYYIYLTYTTNPILNGGETDMKKEEFRSIISGAIANEVESYTFYRGIEKCTSDDTMKKIFGNLAEEERGHRETLEEFLTKPIKSFHFDEARDYKISETLDVPQLTVDMKPKEGIALAIKKEEESRDMYRELAELSTDPEQKKLFTNLSNMEAGHKAQLEDCYTNMAFPEVW